MGVFRGALKNIAYQPVQLNSGLGGGTSFMGLLAALPVTLFDSRGLGILPSLRPWVPCLADSDTGVG
eukprot:632123-Heterocapsa_arctica.AAC.1